MEKKRLKRNSLNFLFGVLLVLSVFLIQDVSAAYSFSNYSIDTYYSKGSSITGKINISFENESLNSFFDDSFGNRIYLKDVLNKSGGYLYNCTYKDCLSSYFSSNPQTTKSVSLSSGQESIVGFVLSGNLVQINSVSFNLTSNAGASDFNQVKIDILDDGIVDFGNYKASSLTGPSNYGCFNSSENANEVSVGYLSFCQKINISESPGLFLGGWFKKISSGDGVHMNIYNKDSISLGNCNLPDSAISVSGNETFCKVNVSVPVDSSYYVCAYLNPSSSGVYRVLGYSSSYAERNCGFYGYPPQNETNSYKIGAKPLKFGIPGVLEISNNLPNGEIITSLVWDYILKNYPQGCSNGCYVPVSLATPQSHVVSLNGLKVSYDTNVGPDVQTSTFYDFSREESKVSSLMQLLPIDGLFRIPLDKIGNQSYSLKFKGANLFTKFISIEEFPIQVSPLKYAVGFPVPFSTWGLQEGLSPSYEIDFGDGLNTVISSFSFSHQYDSVGNFTLKISSYINGSKLSKTFNVEILSVKDFIDDEIEIKRTSLSYFNSQISSLETFEKSEFERIFGLNNLSSQINLIESRKTLAVSDSDYGRIFSDLLSLNIPKSFFRTLSGEKPFITEVNNVNLDILHEITGLNYLPADESASYISFWDYDNLNSKISSDKFLINEGDGSTPNLNFYEISIVPKKTISQEHYIIFPNLGTFNFEDPSEVKSVDGYSYIELKGVSKTIRFSTEEDLGSYAPFFIAPKNVVVSEGGEIPEPLNSNWIIVLGIVGVLLVGLLIYYILHRWYDKKYEHYLFPDKNHLYNAIFYVTNSLKEGISESEVKKSLLEVGWKNEQVTYLLKKYWGKSTGMVDLFGFLKDKEAHKVMHPPRPGKNADYDLKREHKI